MFAGRSLQQYVSRRLGTESALQPSGVFFQWRSQRLRRSGQWNDNNARQVVDIAAPGQNLSSAYYGGETGGNGTTDNPAVSGPGPTGPPSGPLGGPDFYTRGGLFGTSFAAPTVAGGAALLYDAAYSVFADECRCARCPRDEGRADEFGRQDGWLEQRTRSRIPTAMAACSRLKDSIIEWAQAG